MDDYELTTQEQREQMHAADAAICERYADDEEAQRVAFDAAIQIILGDTTVEQLGEAWYQRRRAEREAMEALTGGIIADPRGDATISTATGINRMTVRKARGK